MKSAAKSPKVTLAWKRAERSLAQDGHRLLMVEAWLVAILLVGAYVLLCSSYAAFPALPTLTHSGAVLLAFGFVLLLLALTFLVTLPMLIGISMLASQIAMGERPTLADLFLPFSSPRAHRRALVIACTGLWSFFGAYLGVRLADVDKTTRRDAKTRMRRRARFAGFRFFLFCLPRILLGILTFGSYLLWDVLPRASIAYYHYCQLLSEDISIP